MAEKIYVVRMYKTKDEWFKLSKEERAAFGEKSQKTTKKQIEAGMKVILRSSKAISGEWDYFGVREFPDIETFQKFQDYNSYEESVLVSPYHESNVLVGTLTPFVEH